MDKNNGIYKDVKEIVKRAFLYSEMIQFVWQKYPSLQPIIIDGSYAASIVRRNFESVTDYRHRRSAAEWALIASESLEKGPNAASRKYPSITTDGKQEYLSPAHIKQKTPEAEAYWMTYQHYLPFFFTNYRIIMDTIIGDPELAAIYRRRETHYDNKTVGEEEKEQKQQKQLEEQLQKRKKHNEFYRYRQEIFIARHYDPELRNRQKKEQIFHGNKKSVDGKIEHKVKETDLPSATVEDLRRNKASK